MVMRHFQAVAFFLTFLSTSWGQGYLDTIGYTDLKIRLGTANTPNGAGVTVAQVEAPEGANFAANPSIASGRPNFTMTFNGSSTNPAGFSGHATFVGGNFWGNTSMGTGITNVDAWDANVWINQIVLGNGSGIPVTPYLPKISNHSYIAELDPPGTPNGFFQADAEAILLRSDYLVDRARHIMVVGAGNNNSNSPSALFGSGYNSIAVGTADGSGGHGITSIAVAGRVKPDIVAPDGTVSGATPIVSSAAALLVQTAGNTLNADRPQTIKAILMAGARKSDFQTATGGPWTHSDTQPLDARFGAGMVNINNSHMIMTAGPQPASNSSTVKSTGWDFNTIGAGVTSRTYFFDVAAGQTQVSFSAALTWHRQFQDGDPENFTFDNLNMRLYSANASFGLVGGPLAQSISAVDNVEHIWSTSGMGPGRYAIVVDASGAFTTEYAVAWQFIAVPEPSLIGGFFVIGLVVIRKVKRSR